VKYVHSFLLRYDKRRTTTYDVMKYRDRVQALHWAAHLKPILSWNLS